jgi:iron complex outermembrane receptor protein
MASPQISLVRLTLALAWALAGGGAAFAQSGSTTLPPVVVEEAAPPAQLRRLGIDSLSSAPLAETPLSAAVIDAEQMRDRGVQTLSQAIREEPSAGDAYNTLGYVESLVVRGFRLDSLLNYRRDGLPVSNHTPVAMDNLEAIEIVKGVAAVLGGSGSPGGLVNYRLKRPTDAPLRAVLAEVSERGTVLANGDFGGRAGPGGAFGYRINVAASQRRPYPEDADGRRGFASGYFDWRLNEATTLVAEFDYQALRQVSVPGYGLLDTNGDGIAETLPPPISPRLNLNAQPWSLPFESRAAAGSLRWLQQISSDWRFELRAGGQSIRTDDRIAFPDGCSSGPAYVYPGLCGNYDVDIYDYRSEDEKRRTGTLDALLAGTAVTGAVTHELRFGARRTRYTERFPPGQAFNFVGTTNVFAPVVLPADPAASTLNTQSDLTDTEWSASDVLRAGPGSLWLGARWVRLERSSGRSDGSEAVRYEQDFVTPWVGLGWQPWTGGFGYLSWGRGVEIESVPNRPDQFVNYGAALPALESEQVELGFKQVWADGHALTLALFSIDKPYGDDVPQADGRVLRVAGAKESRHRGLEASGRLVASRWLRLEGRATWLDARTTRAVEPDEVGKRTTNVAPFAASVGVAWTAAAPGFELLNYLNYSGRKPVTADNSVELPSYWQWDVAATYRWRWSGTRMTLAAGVDNVTDRGYWREAPTQSWGGIYLIAAQPRLARLSIAASW